MGAVVARESNAGLGDNVNLTVEDIDVIRKALALYLASRKREYHHDAMTADTERSLALSIAYESDKEYVCRLLRKVGDGTLEARTTEEGSSND